LKNTKQGHEPARARTSPHEPARARPHCSLFEITMPPKSRVPKKQKRSVRQRHSLPHWQGVMHMRTKLPGCCSLLQATTLSRHWWHTPLHNCFQDTISGDTILSSPQLSCMHFMTRAQAQPVQTNCWVEKRRMTLAGLLCWTHFKRHKRGSDCACA
jgi:hypothetical protein